MFLNPLLIEHLVRGIMPPQKYFDQYIDGAAERLLDASDFKEEKDRKELSQRLVLAMVKFAVNAQAATLHEELQEVPAERYNIMAQQLIQNTIQFVNDSLQEASNAYQATV